MERPLLSIDAKLSAPWTFSPWNRFSFNSVMQTHWKWFAVLMVYVANNPNLVYIWKLLKINTMENWLLLYKPKQISLLSAVLQMKTKHFPRYSPFALIKTKTLFQFYFEYCWRFNNILPIGFEIGHANLFSKWMQMRCCAHKMMNLINLANIEHITTCSQKKKQSQSLVFSLSKID